MGRDSRPLAEQFADEAGLPAGARALDVGCGPGALTGVLTEMGRVVRPGGVVGACVWAFDGGMELLQLFGAAVEATGDVQ